MTSLAGNKGCWADLAGCRRTYFPIAPAPVIASTMQVMATLQDDPQHLQPALLRYFKGMSLCRYAFLKAGLYRPQKTKMVILNHISSVLKPGRTTLLLGPPAAGETVVHRSVGTCHVYSIAFLSRGGGG